MKKTIYPIITFVILQLLSCASLVLWIVWYVFKKDEYEGIAELARQTYANSEFSQHNGPSLVLGILFLSFIIIASSLIFIEWLKARMRFKNGTDFISGFTHELMTPLTCIQMNLETLSENKTLPAEKKDKLLIAAFNESKKLQQSINKILQMKSIEHKKNIFNFENTNIKNFLETYMEQTRKEHAEIQLDFNFDISEEIYLKIDKELISIVLNNLIENAIKYSSEIPRIRVNVFKKNKMVEIAVQDFGIGIADNKIKKIFKIFYRGNKNVRGSGLGLYISTRIIKNHHGKIIATSPGLGKGSTFSILLPQGKK